MPCSPLSALNSPACLRQIVCCVSIGLCLEDLLAGLLGTCLGSRAARAVIRWAQGRQGLPACLRCITRQGLHNAPLTGTGSSQRWAASCIRLSGWLAMHVCHPLQYRRTVQQLHPTTAVGLSEEGAEVGADVWCSEPCRRSARALAG